MMRQQSVQSIETTRLYTIDNDDQSSRILEHIFGSREKSCSVPQEIKEEVEVQDSLIDEFADIQLYAFQSNMAHQLSAKPLNSIPETPQKSVGQKESLESTQTGDGKDQHTQVRLPLVLERRLKKRRTESICSGEEIQHVRSLSGTK
jgi:hypothetical protein